MTAFKVLSISCKGLEENDYFMQISMTRTGKVKYSKLPLKTTEKIDPALVIGDFFIEVFHKKWTGDAQMCRVNFYTEFITLNVK